jgi:oxaloacetate decarboxylase gamma subunit
MDMLGQSGVLSVLGMSVVFGFLIIMVISVTLMGKVVHALGADKDVTQPPRPQSGQPGTGTSAAKSTAVAAAITAAVTEYQKNEEGGKHA